MISIFFYFAVFTYFISLSLRERERVMTTKGARIQSSSPVADPEGMSGMHRHTLRFWQLQVYVYVFRGKKINLHVKLSKPNQAATTY
jgi:hypothetical protein